MRATGNSKPCRFRGPEFTPFAAKREKSQCLPLTSGQGSTAALWSSLRSPAGDRGGRRAVFAAAAVAEPPRTVTCSAPEYGMRVGLQWPGTSGSAQGRSPAVCAGWGMRGRNGLRVCGSCGEWRGLGRSQGAHRVPLNDHGHVPSSAAQPAVSPLPHLPLDVGGLRGEVHIPGFPGHPRRELCLQPAISLFLMDVRLAGGHTKGRDLTRFLAWDRYRPPQLSLALGSRAQAATGSGLGPPGGDAPALVTGSLQTEVLMQELDPAVHLATVRDAMRASPKPDCSGRQPLPPKTTSLESALACPLGPCVQPRWKGGKPIPGAPEDHGSRLHHRPGLQLRSDSD